MAKHAKRGLPSIIRRREYEPWDVFAARWQYLVTGRGQLRGRVNSLVRIMSELETEIKAEGAI